MSGRQARARHHVTSADVQVVGYVRASQLVDGLVDALVDALRTGVPVQLLPHHSLFDAGRVRVPFDEREHQRQALHDELVDVLADKEAARNRAKQAQRRNDEAAANEYDADVADLRAKASRLQHALDELIVDTTAPAHAEPFDVQADVWAPALRSIKSSRGRLRQDEASALDLIVPQLRVEPIGTRWQGVATLRIPTSSGVAELGPVRWDIDTAGNKGGQAVALARGNVVLSGETRRKPELVADLVLSGTITREAAMTAVNAPFAELRALLLHTVRGEPWPDWVGLQWQDPVFVQWVHDIYTDPQWVWRGNGRYTLFSPMRQFAVHEVAAEGPLTVAELTSRAGAAVVNLVKFTGDARDGTVRAWRPSLRLVDPGRTQTTAVLGPIMCSCGRPATIVARAPEVVTDLLCECGRMPGGQLHGAPEGLRFPDAYQDLRLSRDNCVADLTASAARNARNLPPRSRRVVDLLASQDGMSEGDLRRAMNTSSVVATLRRLQHQGYIRDVQTDVRRFFLSEAGRAHHDQTIGGADPNVAPAHRKDTP
jgi:hypothetical protein